VSINSAIRNLAFSCNWNDTNDLQSNTSITWDQCDFTCARTPYCTHYAWSTQSNGTCTLKKSTVSRAAAYAVSDPFRLCGLVYDGVDWRNQNFASYCDWTTTVVANQTSLASSCLQQCNTTSGCTHFSWSSNRCSLRSGVVDKTLGRRVPFVDAICGYLITSN
jgi:hypothetical protein